MNMLVALINSGYTQQQIPAINKFQAIAENIQNTGALYLFYEQEEE